MGFTAVDGLMMGTRCGAIDPGVLIYLMDAEGIDARGLEDLIYRKSGLLGVSGDLSSDSSLSVLLLTHALKVSIASRPEEKASALQESISRRNIIPIFARALATVAIATSIPTVVLAHAVEKLQRAVKLPRQNDVRSATALSIATDQTEATEVAIAARKKRRPSALWGMTSKIAGEPRRPRRSAVVPAVVRPGDAGTDRNLSVDLTGYLRQSMGHRVLAAREAVGYDSLKQQRLV